ncbi:Dual specificity tyrosine-phosphorylation-regulated kinase 2 [Orchesella cincta]|uniref:Dual specificity tyrosine-phosphorylation-regulated kinase 2 n=1 Tax=Orchesella cincta TaxID=48709 RepID=A0A1D2M7J7_ORCCI|nr:Dual specificity tyrosine-phosphorylation-regulated kinase 2 [Orchesella cincta]
MYSLQAVGKTSLRICGAKEFDYKNTCYINLEGQYQEICWVFNICAAIIACRAFKKVIYCIAISLGFLAMEQMAMEAVINPDSSVIRNFISKSVIVATLIIYTVTYVFLNGIYGMEFNHGGIDAVERTEIVTFPQIYYLGLEQNGKILSTTSGPNDGYDDSEKFYIHRMHDHISYRYELLESLGKGDTSQVFKALDHKTGAHVALKIIRNEDHLQIDAEQEVSILTQLKNNVNVVEILDSFQFRNHSCIVFELLARNLSRLKFETCYKGFTPQQVKKFIIPFSVSPSLSQEQIVHGDLNLENILLKQEYRDEIKGCAYRAPELILGIEYGTPVDMWAVGCVVVELFTGQKLVPGEDEQDQMACILEVLGKPPKGENEEKWEEDFGPKRKESGKIRGPPGTRDLELVLGMQGAVKPVFLDFVKRCLHWVPEARLKPSQALAHPWIKKMRSKSLTKNGTLVEEVEWLAGNVAA